MEVFFEFGGCVGWDMAGGGFALKVGGDEVVGFAEDFLEAEWELFGIVVFGVVCESVILDLEGGNCWHMDALSGDGSGSNDDINN